MTLSGVNIGFALTGSHCTIPSIWEPLRMLLDSGAEVFPILSRSVVQTDTRFGRAADIRARLVEFCQREPWCDLGTVEAIGPKKLLDLLVVAPCTGNTLAKLAHGISDTPVTLACKAQLRNLRPVVLALSTNDGLGANAPNIGILLGRRFFYFVPYGQDNPEGKSTSLVAKMALLPRAVEAALDGWQLQPMLIENPVQNPSTGVR